MSATPNIENFDFNKVFGKSNDNKEELNVLDSGESDVVVEEENVSDEQSWGILDFGESSLMRESDKTRKLEDLVPKEEVELTIDNDELISLEQQEQKYYDKYNELNEDLIGSKQGIPEGYPRVEFTITEDKPMTNRELQSLKHFLLGYDYVESIQKDGLIRVLMRIQTNSNIKEDYVGLISPRSLKTVLNNMKHHSVQAFYDENTELKGKDIFALYMPNIA